MPYAFEQPAEGSAFSGKGADPDFNRVLIFKDVDMELLGILFAAAGSGMISVCFRVITAPYRYEISSCPLKIAGLYFLPILALLLISALNIIPL